MKRIFIDLKLFFIILPAVYAVFYNTGYCATIAEIPQGLIQAEINYYPLTLNQILFILFIVIVFTAGLSLLWINRFKKSLSEKNLELQKELEQHNETEKMLLKERGWLNNLMDNIPDTIYFKDKESRFVKINKAQAKLLGLNSPDEAIMKSDFDFFLPDHAKEAFEDEKKIIQTGEALVSKTEKIKEHNGNYRWVSATKVPMIDSSGDICGIVGISRDISIRKGFEENLRKSEEKYRVLFGNLLSAFIYFEVLFDEHDEPVKFIFREVNDKFLKIISKNREEVIGREYLDIATFKSINFADYYKKTHSLQQAVNFEFFSKNLGRWLYLSVYSDKKECLYVQFEDIHDRKTAEDQISRSELKFHTLFDNSSDAIFIIDGDKIIDCNRQTYEIFGCSREKIINKSITDLSPTYQLNGETSSKLAQLKIKDALNGISQNFEWLHLRFDGNLFFADVSLNKILIEDSTLIQAIVRDISDWKTTENILKQREIQLKSLAENLPDILIRFDPKLQIIFINNQIEAILGVPAGEVLNKKLYDLPLTDDLKNYWGGAIKEVFEKGEVKKIEFSIPFGGDFKYFECRLIPEFAAGEVVKSVQSVNRDITEQRRNEKIQNAIFKISEAINKTEMVQTLYKSIHEIIGELMPAKNFYLALYDEKDQMLDFPYFVDEFEPVPGRLPLCNGLTEYVLRTGKAILVDEEMDLKLRQSGEVELVGEPTKIWLGIPLKLGEKTFGVMVLQDYYNENAYGEEEERILLYVSEQIAQAINKKKSEYRLVKYAEELKELNAVKDKFFSIISHDLRSPFHALLGVSEILTDESSALTIEETRHLNREMYKTLKNQFKLLENLLEWSRIQTGRISFMPGKQELSFKVNEVINILIGNALKKGIQIVNDVHQGTHVFADENMLRTILHNLISNAIKFTNLRGKIVVSSVRLNNFVEISVADNGIGLSEEEINKLFKLDVQFTKPGTSKEQGTGLGLMLCKELVEKHNGKMRIESKVGTGSNFIFSLPAADV
ncbi:MAG: PAS domain-containing sensor histidine kinase [Ignavibacteriales bacterium]|nr:MAG: PAS domain-containing sensor histidine kinase [Ignavibacteriales bacterium]